MSVHLSVATRGARCWSQSRAERLSTRSKLVPDVANLAIDAAKPGLNAARLAIDAAKTELDAAYLASDAVNAKFDAAKVWIMKSERRSQGAWGLELRRYPGGGYHG
jgi:hypothetical protein